MGWSSSLQWLALNSRCHEQLTEWRLGLREDPYQTPPGWGAGPEVQIFL